MSSNIKIQRICEYCGKEFTAQTTVTKYCSTICTGRAYKARKRSEKVEISNLETARIKNQPIEDLKAKEFLNINEVCKLVGISRRTIYRLIEQGELNKIKVGTRTIIKRLELNKYLYQSNNTKIKPQIKKVEPLQFTIADSYTLTEVQSKYGISEKGLHNLIKRNSIPKIKKGWYTYVPKQIIDELLK